VQSANVSHGYAAELDTFLIKSRGASVLKLFKMLCWYLHRSLVFRNVVSNFTPASPQNGSPLRPKVVSSTTRIPQKKYKKPNIQKQQQISHAARMRRFKDLSFDSDFDNESIFESIYVARPQSHFLPLSLCVYISHPQK